MLVANLAVGPLILEPVIAMVWLVVVILIESAILKLLNWDAIRPSLKDATIANLISGGIGAVLFLMLYNTSYVCTTKLLDERIPLDFCGWTISPIIRLGVFWIVSVAIEGSVLLRLRRGLSAEGWLKVALANGVSYALSIPLLL